MFGANPVRKAERLPTWGGEYWVQDVFYTIQGEGPFVGRPAVFVRMAGCNLRCHFCDTDFESSTLHMTPHELARRIAALFPKLHDPLIVFTGGEPLRQPLGPIMSILAPFHEVQIETAGAIWDDSLAEFRPHIVCSPKTGGVHPEIQVRCRDWKYIVAADDCAIEDGLPMRSTQTPGLIQRPFRPFMLEGKQTVWVQPCEEYKDGEPDALKAQLNTAHAAMLAMRFGYRLSLQTHKLLGLP